MTLRKSLTVKGRRTVKGVRLDHYSDFGVTINPRASLVWQINPSLSAKLMYGRAFRAPSFLELNSNQGLQLQGNPDLDPETIDTLELSVLKKWKYKLSTGINLFWYSSDDLISEASIACARLKILPGHMAMVPN